MQSILAVIWWALCSYIEKVTSFKCPDWKRDVSCCILGKPPKSGSNDNDLNGRLDMHMVFI